MSAFEIPHLDSGCRMSDEVRNPEPVAPTGASLQAEVLMRSIAVLRIVAISLAVRRLRSPFLPCASRRSIPAISS